MKPEPNCLILDEKSWHYKLTKFVWGPKWDIAMDWDAYWHATSDYLDEQLDHLTEAPSNEPYEAIRGPKELDFVKEKSLSLCPYMRRVMFSILFLPVVCIGKALLRVPSPTINFPRVHLSWEKQNRILDVAKYVLLGLIAIGIVYTIFYLPELAIQLGVFGATIGILMGSIFGIRKLRDTTKPWRRAHPIHIRDPNRERKVKPRSTRFDGLKATITFFKAYLHARHKNVCPCLERKK